MYAIELHPYNQHDVVTDFVPLTGSLDDVTALVTDVPQDVLARWRQSGSAQVRTLVVARDHERIIGVALEVHRPLTAYRKIVDVWSFDEWTEDLIVRAIELRAWSEGAVAVKREFRAHDDEWQRSLARGYLEVPVPTWAAPVTAVPGQVGFGQVLWRDRPPARSLPYMRQTTDFTCGPVALQLALCALGLQDEPTRELEVELWRAATTVGGCDPLGLAVAALDHGAIPEVLLSIEDASLLELCRNEEERDLRRFIQSRFRAELAERGVAAKTVTFELDQIRTALRAGALALVLIDEEGMHADSCPHWITVHSVDGDTFFANDPWTDADLGESFLDAIDLPLPSVSLDQLAWYGEPSYRGLVLLTAP